jgi:signal peptidase II
MKNSGGSQRLFWIVGGTVVASDVLTKLLAVRYLPSHPLRIFGDWLTLQLVYNPGAAFGLSVGMYSRWVFLVLAIVALVVLGSMVRQTKPGDYIRFIALGLVCGGAVGNLIDRIRSSRGVVDFIDVGIGVRRWPTFNIADTAVTIGAVALALVLWMEGRQEEGAGRVEASGTTEAS